MDVASRAAIKKVQSRSGIVFLFFHFFSLFRLFFLLHPLICGLFGHLFWAYLLILPILVRLCALSLQVTNTFCYISEKLQSLKETQVSIDYYYRLHITLFVDILIELASWRSL